MTTSSNLWETDLDEFEVTGDGMKSLRDHAKALQKQLRDANKANEALTTERDSFKAKATVASLDSLTATLPAGVKKFLSKDFERDGTEPTEANVKTWLDENGADFGYKPGDTPAAVTPKETGNNQELGRQEVATDLNGEEIDPSLPDEVRSALQLIQNFEAQSQAQNAGATQRSESLLKELEGDTSLSNEQILAKLAAAGAPVVGH